MRKTEKNRRSSTGKSTRNARRLAQAINLENLETRQLMATINVADFGARPNDNADDRAAVINAINNSKAGDTILFNGGVYNFSDYLVIDGDRKTSGLRFGDPVVHALLTCLLHFRNQLEGFTNANLRVLLAEALGVDQLSPGQMSYQLRRLRLHGFIKRRPGRQQYRLTDTGLQTAVAYTLAHDRLLRAGTAQISDPRLPGELRRAYTRFADQACLAA